MGVITMRLTEKQQYAIDWIRRIQSKFKGDVTLRYVDDYWRWNILDGRKNTIQFCIILD